MLTCVCATFHPHWPWGLPSLRGVRLRSTPPVDRCGTCGTAHFQGAFMTQGERMSPGRRTVLGAAVLGTAAAGLPAAAASAQPRQERAGARRHGSYKDLPVPYVIGH